MPLPSLEGCEQIQSHLTGGDRREEQKGGPMQWEAHTVRHKNGPRLLSWPILPLPSLLLTTPLPNARLVNHASGPRPRLVNERAPYNYAKGPTTARRAQPRHPTTAHQAQRPHVRPNDRTSGPMTTRRAQRPHVRPNHDTQRPHIRPNDRTSGPTTARQAQ